MVEAGNRPAGQGFAEEFHVLALDVLHHHDLHLVEEVDGQVGECVPEDRLLDEKDVTAGLLDLLDDVEDVGSLLLQDSIHHGIVRDNHLK